MEIAAMPWLLVLHIMFLLTWCAALFYLPALIASSTGNNFEVSPHEHVLAIRQLFNLLATPAALFTIATGTSPFLLLTFAQTPLYRIAGDVGG